MADLAYVRAIRRFLTTEEEVTAAYQTAFTAASNKQTKVTILSSQFEGGSGSGSFEGDPKVIMEACEFVLANDYDDAAPATGQIHLDHSKHFLRT